MSLEFPSNGTEISNKRSSIDQELFDILSEQSLLMIQFRFINSLDKFRTNILQNESDEFDRETIEKNLKEICVYLEVIKINSNKLPINIIELIENIKNFAVNKDSSIFTSKLIKYLKSVKVIPYLERFAEKFPDNILLKKFSIYLCEYFHLPLHEMTIDNLFSISVYIKGYDY